MINVIAAASTNNVIGKNGSIPWHLPADLKHFKEITMGHPVVMGRLTFESIINFAGKPLPGRKNIVVSTSTTFSEYDDVDTVSSLEEALKREKDVFVIGGERMYAQSLPLTDRIYLTRVQEHIDGDTYFPEIDTNVWKLINEEKHSKDDNNPYDYTFLVYERK